MFGDGSDGSLTVNSGTVNLLLNRKYQYTDVLVGPSGQISTSSTTGSVLYITATNSITINGKIDVSGKLNPGHFTDSVVIDGVTYTVPGVANGGAGYALFNATAGTQSNGFGGGGSGGRRGNGINAEAGDGGNGSATFGTAGSPVSTSSTNSGYVVVTGNDGSGSAGGSGGAYAYSTGAGLTAYSGSSGRGGTTYGANGSAGGAGYYTYSGGPGSYLYGAMGGGGAGGIAGKSGAHVVLKAPTVIINGTVITKGTAGGNGGSGGQARTQAGLVDLYAGGGGGGGGGKAGNVEIFYNTSLTDTGTYTLTAGAAGLGGIGSDSNSAYASNGTAGTSGTKTVSLAVPVANFTASTASPFTSASMTFTDTSYGATSWSWNFGDATTSTAQNPSKTYSAPGTYTVTLTATNSAGSDVETKTSYITVTTKSSTRTATSYEDGTALLLLDYESATMSIAQYGTARGSATLSTVIQQLAQKDYEYRVFDADGDFIGVWNKEVKSDFSYSHRINENASELNVTLARSPDTRVVKYDVLKDDTGAIIADENSSNILVPTSSPNSVGAGTDVDINLNVDVYAFYGGFDQLLDENSDPILDTNGDNILIQTGFPNGIRVYSGYIMDYELVHGPQTGVNVVIAPHATDMNNYVFMDALDNTSVAYLNTDPVQMARDAMDNYNAQGGIIDYTVDSMPLSGETTDYEFKLQTTREVNDKAINLLSAGWYHYVSPGERRQYMLQQNLVADHVFYYEKHIKELKLRKTQRDLVNKVYFTGGEYDPIGHPGESLFKYYEDAPSIAAIRPALQRVSDSRVTLESSADVLGARPIEVNKGLRYRSTVVIPDAVYDIETIKLGQMVGFKNFGTETDDVLIQIVAITRAPHSVTLELDTALNYEAKRLDTLQRQINNEAIRNIPDKPI